MRSYITLELEELDPKLYSAYYDILIYLKYRVQEAHTLFRGREKSLNDLRK